MNWQAKCRALRGIEDELTKHAFELARQFCGNSPSKTHPLSNIPFPKDLLAPSLDDVQARLREFGPGETETDFLRLWRYLPDPKAIEDESIRSGWRFAEDETSGTNLWDFRSLASALVGVEKPALLQFNLADVQPFVTRARRTQDLWAGSYLVSFFCWQVMKSLANKYGPDCILQPVLREQPLVDLWLQDEKGLSEFQVSPGDKSLLIANIPNIFTAILPYEEAEEAICNGIAAARGKWQEISTAVRDQVQAAANSKSTAGWDSVCEDIWKRQEEDFLSSNIFWAALEIPNSPEALKQYEKYLPPSQSEDRTAYGICSQLCAILLSDRKRARDFQQVNEPGVKCSLSGALQALAPGNKQSLSHTRIWWKALSEVRTAEYKMAGRIRLGDQLCATFLTKRLMMQAYFDKKTGIKSRKAEPVFDRHQFPSTAGIANTPFLVQIAQWASSGENSVMPLNNYVAAVTELLGDDFFPASFLPAWEREISKLNSDSLMSFFRIDGDLLYDEFYDLQRFLREFGRDPDIEALKKTNDARKNLIQAVQQAQGAKFMPLSRYYAIIAMDGDNMGNWVSGKRPGTENSENPEEWEQGPLTPGMHQAFTSALSGFALRDARRIVEEENSGKLVYAGGDDVLAILPVADLLPVMHQLYRAFRGSEGDASGFARNKEGVWELRMGDATLSAGAVIVHESLPLSFAMEQARAAEKRAKETLKRDAFAITLLKRSGAPIEAGMKWQSGEMEVIKELQNILSLLQGGLLSSKVAYDLGEDPIGTWSGRGASEARQAEFRRRVERHIKPGEKRNQKVQQFLERFTQLVAEEGGWDRCTSLLLVLRSIAQESAGSESEVEA
jgi:CRISPR-associated protein Cmr2